MSRRDTVSNFFFVMIFYVRFVFVDGLQRFFPSSLKDSFVAQPLVLVAAIN